MAGEKDRRIASNRAQAIDYLGTRNKLPKITRFENCTIDSARGVITVAHDGRIKVLVTRIPTREHLQRQQESAKVVPIRGGK